MATYSKAICVLTALLLCVPLRAGEDGPGYLKVKDLTPVRILETAEHQPVVIVREGAAQAKVYVADEHPSRNLTILVKELVEAVKLSTGAELEVVKEMPAEGVPAIVIGDCAASRAAGIDAAKIPIEGFIVKTAPNRVYLVGSAIPLPAGSDQWSFWHNDGTAWAVADFLERFVGVRWYWPVNVGGRSVLDAKTLTVRPAYYSDEPVFRKREFYPNYQGGYQVPRADEGGKRGSAAPPEAVIPASTKSLDMSVLLAGLRNGNSWPYVIKVHMPQQIWKSQALVDAHKEMFMKKANGERNFSMLCYSSPETYDFLMAGCEAVWDKKPSALARWNNYGASWVTATCVTLSPFDEPINCCCENCRKLYDANGGNRGTGSKIMGVFVKKFAEEVKRRWPDKKVIYLPYWNYTVFPKGLEFPDNLEIQMCTMAFAMMRQPGWRAQMETCMRDWGKAARGKIQTWEYPHRTVGYPGVQLQYPHLVEDYYQHNRDVILGSFLNGGDFTDWTKTAPTLYCCMKALWNPGFDVDVALDVMCERMFGKAAGTARELLQLMSDRWEKTPWSIEMDDMGYLEPAIYRETWPPDVVAQMSRLWEKARLELKDDLLASQRFQYVTWSLEYFPAEVREQQSSSKKR